MVKEATNKLQKGIGNVNTSLKKPDKGKLNDVSNTIEKSGEAAKEITEIHVFPQFTI